MANTEMFKQMITHIYKNWQSGNILQVKDLYSNTCVGLLCGNGTQNRDAVLQAYGQLKCEIDVRTLSVDVIEKGGAYLVVAIGKAKIQNVNDAVNFVHSLLVSVNGQAPCIHADIFSITDKESKSTNADFKQLQAHVYDCWTKKNWDGMAGVYDDSVMGIFGTKDPSQGKKNVLEKYSQMNVKFDNNQLVTHSLCANGAHLVYSKGVMMLDGQTNPLSFAHILLCHVAGNAPKILLDIFKPVY